MLKKRFVLAGLALALMMASASVRADEDLMVGSPAPELNVAEWIQGDSVAKFEKEKVYVVEFWATWCPPCIKTIPHLNELSKKYADVTFIGVSVFEHDNFKSVPAFVKKMGDKMTYRVATDSVPEGKEAREGFMAQKWMDAANQSGIPTTFIVNGDGVVAWIGHPMRMDDPLDQIVNGKWDVKAAAKEFREKIEPVKVANQAQKALTAAMTEKNVEKIAASIAAIGKGKPSVVASLGQRAITTLAKDGDKDKVMELVEALSKGVKNELTLTQLKFDAHSALKDTKAANELADKLFELAKGSPQEGQTLTQLALKITNNRTGERNFAVALKAAERANELLMTPISQYYVAMVLFEKGDLDKAVETQRKAVEMAEGSANAASLKNILKRYEDAAKKKESKDDKTDK